MERIPGFISTLCLVTLAIVFGVHATFAQRFPAPEIIAALRSMNELSAQWFEDPRSIVRPGRHVDYPVTAPARASTGLLLVTAIDREQRNFVAIIDRSGQSVHRVPVDWFDHGPDPAYLPEKRRPHVRPGGMLDGIAFLDDGSFIANIDHLTTLRMDFCGEVIWALENLGHHFVVPARDGNFWVGSEVHPAVSQPERIPNHTETTRDWTVQKISPEGEILDEINLLDLIFQNDLLGLLYQSELYNEATRVGDDTFRPGHDDTLHLNDVDEFPDTLPPGTFTPGDLMISLRNIHGILVVDPETRRIKDYMIGPVLRQHDPEFVSGDEILVYDNRTLLPLLRPENSRSRIVSYDFTRRESKEVFRTEIPWYSQILGKQQQLANGNLLVTVSTQGQALEITPEGEIAWTWSNRIEDGGHAFITEVSELPARFDRAFFEEKRRTCPAG